ncbi:MAG: hypothetical protein AAF630_19235 [Cyanobacteria bacterium P01_C01_bin.38]
MMFSHGWRRSTATSLNVFRRVCCRVAQRTIYLTAWEHPNFAEIKFVVRASCSLATNSEQDARTTKINLHIWDAPVKIASILHEAYRASKMYVLRTRFANALLIISLFATSNS